MPNEEQLINCLNVNIPQTDDTLIACREFISSECVIEGEKTQKEINEQIEQLQTQVQYLTQQFNQTVSNNNIVKQIDFGNIGITPIQTTFNNQSQLTIGRNDIYVVKAIISGTPLTYVFGKGKGTYGIGGTTTISTDFIQI